MNTPGRVAERHCHRCGRWYLLPKYAAELPCHGVCYSPRPPASIPTNDQIVPTSVPTGGVVDV